ncbi:type II toxin-antitoxin system HipA family toxin [Aerophototrophica crusticola]
MVPVFYETFLVGEIAAEAGGPVFRYDPRWQRTRGAFPVSVTMPLAVDRHGPDRLVPWLANLLPEGDILRTVGRAMGIAAEDVLGLVGRIGRDTAGALAIGAPREGEEPDYLGIAGAPDLERIINDLPRRPFLVGEDGVSMSLAGAQHKLPVALQGDRLAIPVDGAPSTHILKPDNPNLFGSVQNEALCMVLARRAGLDVAPVTTGRVGDRTYLLVQRYDRFRHGAVWRRQHQEDFCQALGLPPAAKYEHDGSGTRATGLPALAGLLRREARPGALLPFLDAVILNVLLANVDSHAKNYSLLFDRAGEPPRLAPLYDLMCAAAWENITQNHAQSIGGERRGRQVRAKHWARMATACGLNARAVLRRVADLGHRVQEGVDAAVAEVRAMPAGDHAMLPVFADAIRQRCRTVVLNVSRDPGAGENGPDDEGEAGLPMDRLA